MARERISSKLVKLFYLGGLEGRAKNNSVTSADRVYSLPPKGEFIEVPESVALDIERKHVYLTADQQPIALFTRDPRLAFRVKNGMNPITMQMPTRSILDTTQLSDEELVAELEKRKLINNAEVTSEKAKVKTPAAQRAPRGTTSKKKPLEPVKE